MSYLTRHRAVLLSAAGACAWLARKYLGSHLSPIYARAGGGSNASSKHQNEAARWAGVACINSVALNRNQVVVGAILSITSASLICACAAIMPLIALRAANVGNAVNNLNVS